MGSPSTRDPGDVFAIQNSRRVLFLLFLLVLYWVPTCSSRPCNNAGDPPHLVLRPSQRMPARHISAASWSLGDPGPDRAADVIEASGKDSNLKELAPHWLGQKPALPCIQRSASKVSGLNSAQCQVAFATPAAVRLCPQTSSPIVLSPTPIFRVDCIMQAR